MTLCYATSLFQTNHLKMNSFIFFNEYRTSFILVERELILCRREALLSMRLNFQMGIHPCECVCSAQGYSTERKEEREDGCCKSSKVQNLTVTKRCHSPDDIWSSVNRNKWLNSSTYICCILLSFPLIKLRGVNRSQLEFSVVNWVRAIILLLKKKRKKQEVEL